MKKLREYCYERYPYEPESATPFGTMGNGPGISFLNCYWLVPFMKLSKPKQVKLLDALYRECASLNLSSVHVTIGKSQEKTIKSSRGVKVQGPSSSKSGTIPKATKVPAPEENSKPKSSKVTKVAKSDAAWINKLFPTFEREKKTDIDNLKDKKQFEKDTKTMSFDELKTKWVGIGKISKSKTTDDELKQIRDKNL